MNDTGMIKSRRDVMIPYLSTVGIVITILFAGYVGIYLILDHNTNSMNMMGMSNNDSDIKSIHMGMNMFMPNELHIESNTTISWETHDMKIHNVSGIFKTDSGKEIPILSGDIDHLEQWSYTFEESGVFEYICGYHEGKGMKGKLIVS